MVSRSTGPLRKILPAVAVGLAAVLVGCGAGQVTQTDSMEPAVSGNTANVGDIALRNVLVAHPDSGAYSEGEDLPLVLTIVNTGREADELVSVTSPAIEGEAELIGGTSLPAKFSVRVVEPEEGGSATTTTTTTTTTIPEESITEPSAPADTGVPGSESPSSEPPVTDSVDVDPSTPVELPEVGTMHIVLRGLVSDLPPGRNVPVTFVFAKAGEVTLQLPVASPATARVAPTGEAEEGGH